MDSLGEHIKRERERKGITLEEASKTTRIGKRYLQAIEEGNFEIQSPVFMRGFIRSYAEFLGLDSGEILGRYRELAGEKEEKAEEEVKAEPGRKLSRYIVPAIIAVSVITLAVIKIVTTEKPVPKTVQEAAVSPPEPKLTNVTTQAIAPGALFRAITAPAKPRPQVVEPAAPAPLPEKGEKRHTLIITAKELAWLRITVDDGEPREALMREGETTTWLADKKFTIVSGNAGGIDLNLDGKQMEGLGPSGKVVTKVLP